MTLNIEFTAQEEAWLNAQSAQQGFSPAEIIRRMVDERLHEHREQTTLEINAKTTAAIALLDSWIAEGASADEQTKLQAEQEVEEFKRNMNSNRAATAERLIFP